LVALSLDPERFAEHQRLAGYNIANTLLLANLDLQRAFGLRAEEFQVLLVIVVATVQRYARERDPDPAYRSKQPLPSELASSISRRRIAEILAIPLETVRRHVTRLIAAGLIVERGRGRLATPGGTLQRLDALGAPARVTSQVLALANTLIRDGIFTPAPVENHHPTDEPPTDAAAGIPAAK
jgi:hypothetical protein